MDATLRCIYGPESDVLRLDFGPAASEGVEAEMTAATETKDQHNVPTVYFSLGIWGQDSNPNKKDLLIASGILRHAGWQIEEAPVAAGDDPTVSVYFRKDASTVATAPGNGTTVGTGTETSASPWRVALRRDGVSAPWKAADQAHEYPVGKDLPTADQEGTFGNFNVYKFLIAQDRLSVHNKQQAADRLQQSKQEGELSGASDHELSGASDHELPDMSDRELDEWLERAQGQLPEFFRHVPL